MEEIKPMDKLINQAMDKIKKNASNGTGIGGIGTGFYSINRVMQGWDAPQVVVIGARTGMGSTSFILNIILDIAINQKKSVLLFSLHHAPVEIVNRLAVIATEFTANKIKSGNLTPYEWEILDHKMTPLRDVPIFIDDSQYLTVNRLRERCIKFKEENDLDIIFLDYLQLMPDRTYEGNREQELSHIMRTIKSLAKEINTPIIIVSKTNRSANIRHGDNGKKPQLSDLRDSGAIEEVADIVCFIHRPEYYRIIEDIRGNSLIGISEIIIAKNSSGPTADVRLKFKKDIGKFSDITEDDCITESDIANNKEFPDFPDLDSEFDKDMPF